MLSNGQIRKRINLKNPQWSLVLDPTNLRFYLRSENESTSSADQGRFVIKQISLKQMKKFGRDIAGTNYPILPGYIIKCYVSRCRHWVNGLCIKHPLVFVKEQRQTKKFYTAKETLPEFLYLTESTIPRAGLGIFTRIFLPAGVAFGPYAGHISDGNEQDFLKYAWQITRLDWSQQYVDGENEWMSNWMRYVNSSRWEEEQNMVSCFFHRQMYYYTYKSVAANTELLVWYGEDYGRHLGIAVEYPPDYTDRNTAPPKSVV